MIPGSCKKKIWKKRADASELDKKLAQHLIDLEAAQSELKGELRNLQFSRVVEVNVNAQKKAYVIFVPYVLRKRFQAIQVRLTRELSKKYSGSDILFVAERVILPRSYIRRKGNQQRPRSRTLTAVHEAILEDIAYPTTVVGKRTHITSDGKRTLKVYLSKRDQKECDEKKDTFAAVYRQFCNKKVQFLFPETE